MNGVRAQMKSFDYYFGFSVAKLVLDHGDNLSLALQGTAVSAAGGQRLTSLTAKTLATMRTAETFTLFWDLLKKTLGTLHVNEHRLSRSRTAPQRLDTANRSEYFPVRVEDHYGQIYFKVLDFAISTINVRFDQPGYAMYRQLEDLLLKTVHAEDASDEFRSVTDYYGDDFARDRLSVQLTSLAAQFDESKELCLQDILTYVQEFPSAEHVIFSEVLTVLRLTLVNPATNATSESSFSAMRRLKK